MAILLTCWLVLLIGGTATYVAIRGAVLEDLDASLVLRASSLPEVLGVNPNAPKGEQLILPPGDRYIVKDAVGHTLARPGLDASEQPRRAEVRGARFATLADGTRVRSVTLVFPAMTPGGEGEMTIVYSRTAEHFDELLSRLWLVFAIAGPACGLLTALVAMAVARQALRPLTASAATITSIDERTLDRRLEPKTLPPELRPMADRLNQMLARLEDGLRQRKQFMADAAHELRTPVSAMLTSMEVSLRRPRDVASLTQTMTDCIGDARVLRRLVTALLEQFKSDATTGSAVREVDVSAILDLCADSLESSARQNQVALRRMYPSGLRFNTQPDRFRSIAANLMDNALEYNVPNGWVEVTCELGNNGLTLSVSDSGKGISETRLPHVFEPFYHGEKDRPVESGHCGLGLFLVKSHVDALRGTLDVRSTPDSGSTFTARLPVMTAAVEPAAADAAANDGKITREIQGETAPPLSLSSNGPGTNFQVKC
jgi:two-component system OmpR family sensor kinase